jgi:hypothetical protein
MTATRHPPDAVSIAPERDDPWPSYGLLLGTVTASVAVLGAVPEGAVQQVVVSALLGASVILAFHIARTARTLVLLAWGLALLGLAVSVLHVLDGAVGDGTVRLLSAVLVSLGPPAIALGVVRSLRMSGRVRLEAVMGVLALYMLIGMLFAFVYAAIDHFGGDPFFSQEGATTVARCVYFSFTTLTTVGFGDLTARTDLGHTLAVFEALLGQIYLVTVVSLIVSNLGRARPRRS